MTGGAKTLRGVGCAEPGTDKEEKELEAPGWTVGPAGGEWGERLTVARGNRP